LPLFLKASNATHSQKAILREIIDFQSFVNFILRFASKLDSSRILLPGRSQIIDNSSQKVQNIWLLKIKSAKIPPEGIVKFCKK
jgi:hypothetical protein